MSVYLKIFLSGSILWRQRVISLSHLNQLLLNDLFLLQQPDKSGLRWRADIFFRALWNRKYCWLWHWSTLATLTMSLAETGAGWGAGAISFKVSDRASRALSATARCWAHKQRQKDSDVLAGLLESLRRQKGLVVLVCLPVARFLWEHKQQTSLPEQ